MFEDQLLRLKRSLVLIPDFAPNPLSELYGIPESFSFQYGMHHSVFKEEKAVLSMSF